MLLLCSLVACKSAYRLGRQAITDPAMMYVLIQNILLSYDEKSSKIKSALCNVLMTSRKCYITMTSAQKFSTATMYMQFCMCLLPSHDDYSHVFRYYNLSMQEENKLRLFIGHNKLSSAFIQIHTCIYIY